MKIFIFIVLFYFRWKRHTLSDLKTNIIWYLGAGAAHGWAEEEVDDQHDEEEDPEGDAEVEQPHGVHAAVLAQGLHLHCRYGKIVNYLFHRDRMQDPPCHGRFPESPYRDRDTTLERA